MNCTSGHETHMQAHPHTLMHIHTLPYWRLVEFPLYWKSQGNMGPVEDGLVDRRAFQMGLSWITYAFPPLGLSGVAGVSSRCEKACNPRMGNLALGRKLWTDTTCGQNATELYCFFREKTDLTCQQPTCDKCNAAQPHLAHQPAAMADSPFRHPRTWWQSAEEVHREKIQLDLEAEFYFTHLIMVFRSPRPAAMVLDRSQDFGKTWKPYKYFATNCSATFGLEDDVVKKGAICTSRYSNPFPCTGGEVRAQA